MKEDQLLHLLGDERTLQIFQAVRHDNPEVDKGMTRKEFYSRMHKLKVAGLIRMKNGYHLTALGTVVGCKIVDIAKLICQNYWRLKTVDALTDDIPEEHRDSILTTLIRDEGLKQVLK